LRIAIVGSRHFAEPARVIEYVRSLPPKASIITGSARGVHAAATKAAREKGIPVQVLPSSLEELADAARSAARNQWTVDACHAMRAF